MSLKDKCKDSGEGYYTLDTGGDVPVRIFLSPKLYAEAEEGLFAQIRAAAAFPGTLEVVVTPDAHIGSGVPVGCVIATDGALLQAPIGYDIGCGIVCFRSEVPHTKGLDEKLRRKFSEEVTKRIGLGVGQRGTVSVTHKAFQRIIREGATAVGYSRTHSERDFLPVDDDGSGMHPFGRSIIVCCIALPRPERTSAALPERMETLSTCATVPPTAHRLPSGPAKMSKDTICR